MAVLVPPERMLTVDFGMTIRPQMGDPADLPPVGVMGPLEQQVLTAEI
jgi:hypothetical protein